MFYTELNMRAVESLKKHGYKYLVIVSMLTTIETSRQHQFEVMPIKEAIDAPQGLTYLIDGAEVWTY